MNGQTMQDFGLVRSLGSQDADKVKENNSWNTFYNMKNKYGNDVKIAPHLVNDCLKRGFQHTDGKVYTDNTPRVERPVVEKDPSVAMAKATELMAKTLEKLSSGNENSDDVVVKPKKGPFGRPLKKTVVIEEKAVEVESTEV